MCINSNLAGPPAAAPNTFTYDAADSPYNYTYILRTEKVDLATATTYCNQKGGHVVWYKDQGEQFDVENYFANKTQLLLPYYHTYWIGATAAAAGSNKWPNFRWVHSIGCASACWGFWWNALLLPWHNRGLVAGTFSILHSTAGSVVP